MSLKAELNKLRRELAHVPAEGAGEKWVLPPNVWACIAGTLPWDALTTDERAVWDQYQAWVERVHRLRDLEAELAALNPNTPEENDQ